jgi:hypothetical protein
MISASPVSKYFYMQCQNNLRKWGKMMINSCKAYIFPRSMVDMKHRSPNHSISSFSTFIFAIFSVSILFFSGYQYYKSVYALNEDDQKPYFHFVSEQNHQCTENLSEGQTFMNEDRCAQICPTGPSTIIPEGCIPQPQGQDQSTQDQQQQPQGQDQSTQDQQQQPQGQDQSTQDQQQQPQGDFTIPNNASTTTFANTLKGGPIISPNLHFPDASECFKDLTDKWIGNDGGKYYIREIGNVVWWFGFNTLTIGEGFSNVFYGTRNETTILDNPKIYGQWQDVPLGETRANGNLGLLIDPTGTKITKFWSLGDYFGGSEWTRATDCSRIASGIITGSDGGRP